MGRRRRDLEDALLELVAALMGPPEKRARPADVAEGGLKGLLRACAAALAEGDVEAFEGLVGRARAEVSVTGDPLQRLGAYMVEGMVARIERSGSNIYRALRCREPEGKDLLSYMHILYEVCPYLKFGYFP